MLGNLVYELFGSFDLYKLGTENGEDDADKAGSDIGDDTADVVGQQEHYQAAENTAVESVGCNALALEALLAVGKRDDEEGHYEDADHMEEAGCREVEVRG